VGDLEADTEEHDLREERGGRTDNTSRELRAAGEVPANKDPKALARFLVSTLHGVRVLARAGVDRTVLDDSVRTALEVLR
jgi:hypothetical protein